MSRDPPWTLYWPLLTLFVLVVIEWLPKFNIQYFCKISHAYPFHFKSFNLKRHIPVLSAGIWFSVGAGPETGSIAGPEAGSIAGPEAGSLAGPEVCRFLTNFSGLSFSSSFLWWLSSWLWRRFIPCLAWGDFKGEIELDYKNKKSIFFNLPAAKKDYYFVIICHSLYCQSFTFLCSKFLSAQILF